MTDKIRNILLGVGAVLILLVASCALRAAETPKEIRNWQRLEQMEFRICTRGKPPQIIADGINNSAAVDPQKWLPAIKWWNDLVEDYKRAGCGET